MVTIEIRKSEKLRQPLSGFVSFDYKAEIVATIKALPFRIYNVDTKEWEIPTDDIDYLKGKLVDEKVSIIEKEKMKPKFNIIPTDYEFKTQPFTYQREGIEYGLKYDNWLLADQQGLGKSYQLIHMTILRKQLYGYKHCLIICGINGLKWNWLNEIHTHSNQDGYILGQKCNKKGKLKIGSGADKIASANSLLKNENEFPYFIITNVESLRDQKLVEALKKCCDKNIINFIAFDEIQVAKSPTSQQSKGLLKLNAECKIGMSGTPLMNSPMDLYIILKWLGYETHPYGAFKNHYCVMGGYGNYNIVGYKNLESLQSQIDKIMLRRLKKDVLDLPDKVYVDEFVEMSKQQANIYAEVETDIRNNIDLIMTSPSPLSALIRLRQATGYTGILSSTIQESAKLDRMEELVAESVSNGDKCIIFSNWTQMTDIIKTRLKNYNPAVITGQIKDEERRIQKDMFMENERCKVIIGTIGAMGVGLTLTAGTTVIFLDEPWTKAAFEQAVDRAHRIGTKSNVTIYSIMCKDTIDVRVHELIAKKGKMSDMLIDGELVGSKSEIFNFLLS